MLGPADEVMALGQPPMQEAIGTERCQALGRLRGDPAVQGAQGRQLSALRVVLLFPVAEVPGAADLHPLEA